MLACVLSLTAGSPAFGAELRVYCPNALRTPVLELARSFVRSHGHKIEFVFASVGAIHKRVATGENTDVVIGTVQGVDALVGLGRGLEGSDAVIARTALALALRRGEPAPDITTADALVQRLRSAQSLVLPDAGLGAPGGAQVEQWLESLGIFTEIKAKIRLVGDAREVVKRVASGAAEIGVAAMSDLVGVTDVSTFGPLLEPPTIGVSYAAVVSRRSVSAHAARVFIGYLTTREAQAVFRAAGFSPGQIPAK